METTVHYQEQLQSLTNEVQKIRDLLKGYTESSNVRTTHDDQLKYCYSLLKATVESTMDGILVVDTFGKITIFNNKFTEMWKIPNSIVETLDDNKILSFVVEQIKDPEIFLSKVRELYSTQESESFDVLEFKDGRTFERFSKTQKINEKVIGRVWSFRDVTDHVKTDKLLRQLTLRNTYLSSITSSLFRSVDYEDTLKSIQRSIVPKLAEAYSLDILDENERIKCIDFSYPDASLSHDASNVRQKFSYDSLALTGIPKVFRSGKSELYSETSDLILHEVFPSESFIPVLEKMRIYSIMLVPLFIRGRVFGVVSLMSSNIDHHFTWDDLRFSEDVCVRISLALDNAIHFRKKNNTTKIVPHESLPIRLYRILIRRLLKDKGLL